MDETTTAPEESSENTISTPKGVTKKRNWFKIILITIVLLIAVLGVILGTYNYWFPRLVGIASLKTIENKDPFLGVAPTNIELGNQIASTTPYTIQAFSFVSPLNNPIEVKNPETNFLTITYSPKTSTSSGVSLIILQAPSLYSDPSLDQSKEFYGAMNTNYKLYSGIVDTVPSDVRFSSPPSDFLLKTVLLEDKSWLLPISTTTKVYSFTTDQNYKGYEFDNGTLKQVTLFTPNDVPFNLFFTGFTQNQINQTLQSIKPTVIPASST